MNQTKRQYESTFIINASLEDTEIESTISRVAETVTRNGGEIIATNRWGRKRLAYTIQKKNNGYYVNLEFIAPGGVIPQMERIYQLDENILRFLNIQLDKRAIEAKKLAPPPPIEVVTSSSPTETPIEERQPLFDDDTTAPAIEPEIK